MKMIPLLIKEGLGVVDWHGDAGTHHPHPLLRRGGESFSEQRLVKEAYQERG
jgi:hypothetical protein